MPAKFLAVVSKREKMRRLSLSQGGEGVQLLPLHLLQRRRPPKDPDHRGGYRSPSLGARYKISREGLRDTFSGYLNPHDLQRQILVAASTNEVHTGMREDPSGNAQTILLASVDHAAGVSGHQRVIGQD